MTFQLLLRALCLVVGVVSVAWGVSHEARWLDDAALLAGGALIAVYALSAGSRTESKP